MVKVRYHWIMNVIKEMQLELKRLQLDPNCSSDDVIDYLCTLNEERYKKYAANLRAIFGEDIDKSSSKYFESQHSKHG